MNICRNGHDEKESGKYLHAIFANDKTVCQYIRNNNFKKNDEVMIHGRIGYRTNTEADGKQTIHCFIVANNVYKTTDRIKHIYNRS